MNRRGFLKLLAPASALLIAPELLLPKKTFFLPPKAGWHGDAFARFYQRAYQRMIDNIVNPPILYFEDRFWAAGKQTVFGTVPEPGLWEVDEALHKAVQDRSIYGTGVIEVKSGKIHHVPIGAMWQPFVGESI